MSENFEKIKFENILDSLMIFNKAFWERIENENILEDADDEKIKIKIESILPKLISDL